MALKLLMKSTLASGKSLFKNETVLHSGFGLTMTDHDFLDDHGTDGKWMKLALQLQNRT